MPAMEVAFRFDYAVLWEANGVDRDNEEQVKTPYELLVRWDDRFSQMRDSTGKLVRIDASIITDQDVPMSSILWQGMFKDLPVPVIDNLYKVIAVEVINDIRGGETYREYGLTRYKRTLPAVTGTS